jgi:hypothetical protein
VVEIGLANVILGIEQATVKTDSTEDLLRGLLQVVGGQDIGWIDKKTSRGIKIQLRSVEQLHDGLVLAPSVTVHR